MQICSLAGIVAGIWLASRYGVYVGAWLKLDATVSAAGGFVGALALHAQANGVGFLAPEDSWNLTYGAIEIPVLVVSVALLVWGLRRHRATLEA